MNRDVPLIPNLWKLIRQFKKLEATAGILNNRRKGNKYHSAKAKNDRIRRVIMNNSFDLIECDPGNVYKYMEYMTMLDAAHEHKICQIIFLLKPLLETIYWFNGKKVKLVKSNILLTAIVKIFPGYSTVKKYKKSWKC